MEAIIKWLIRAAAAAEEPVKAMLTHTASDLGELMTVTSGILHRAQIGQMSSAAVCREPEMSREDSLQVYVGHLYLLSAAAEEPMKNWLQGVGNALLFLGEVMATPPPRRESKVGPKEAVATQTMMLPQINDAIPRGVSVRLPLFHATGYREAPIESPDWVNIKCKPVSDEAEERFSFLEELREPVQTSIPLLMNAGRILVRLPGYPVEDSRDAPMLMSDSTTIHREPMANDVEMHTLEDMHEPRQAHESRGLRGPTIPLRANDQHSKSLGAFATGSKGWNDMWYDEEPLHMGGITIGKRSRCSMCKLEFPSRKKLRKHLDYEHLDHAHPLWKRHEWKQY